MDRVRGLFRGIYRGVQITQEGPGTRLVFLTGPHAGSERVLTYQYGRDVMPLDLVRAIINQHQAGVALDGLMGDVSACRTACDKDEQRRMRITVGFLAEGADHDD